MTEVKKEFDIEVDVVWDGAVGEIDPDAFKKNLPEDLPEEVFEKVDSYRDQLAAAVGEKVLDYAEGHFQNNDTDLSVADYSVGGNATLSMTMSNDYQLVTSITIASNEALDVINQKAKDLYKEKMSEQ